MSRDHPEKRDDEIFVGNTDRPIPDYLLAIKSHRLGSVAYFIDGGEIPASWNVRPHFISRADADAYDRIMMARLSAIKMGH